MRIIIPRYEDYEIAGLPPRSWPITNSERMGSACPRQYMFRYIDGLTTKKTATPLRFGTAFHEVMETIFGYWSKHDSECPMGEVSECLHKIEVEWREQAAIGLIEHDDLDDIIRLRKAIEGWICTYGLQPYQDYEVIGVEVALCAPIINPSTGKIYKPNLPYIEDGSGFRLARTGEASLDECKWKQWPAYQIGKLDYILKHRRTGAVWAGDHKTSARPSTYLNGMTVDPQMPGYLWMLRHGIRNGTLPKSLIDRIDPDAKIAGFMYDVSSSAMQSDPQLLKSGKFSTAKSKKVPSWRFERTLISHGMTLDSEPEYREYYNHCRSNNDHSFYERDFMAVGPESLDRYACEIFGEAVRLAGLRRTAANAETEHDIFVSHPRVPICKMPGGHCSYKGPCLQDGAIIRNEFDIREGIRWEPFAIKQSSPSETPKGDLSW